MTRIGCYEGEKRLIQVNHQNKTIAVTAEESVTADAEVAVLEIGYHNYATTQEQAFADNVRVADTITKALLGGGGIPKANIETEKLRLGRAESTKHMDDGNPCDGICGFRYRIATGLMASISPFNFSICRK